jgi:hypothetical protein
VPEEGRSSWLHHGSSISHGSDAASPTTTWPALAASLGGVELIMYYLDGRDLYGEAALRAPSPAADPVVVINGPRCRASPGRL